MRSQFELDNSYRSYKSTEIGENRWRLRRQSIEDYTTIMKPIKKEKQKQEERMQKTKKIKVSKIIIENTIKKSFEFSTYLPSHYLLHYETSAINWNFRVQWAQLLERPKITQIKAMRIQVWCHNKNCVPICKRNSWKLVNWEQDIVCKRTEQI